MKQASSKRRLSPQAIEELKTQIARVQPFASAARMWRQLLTPADRKKLGGDLQKAYAELRTAGMWAKARGTNCDQAVLDVALGIDHLSQAKYEWLLRELGLRQKTPNRSAPPKARRQKSPVPNWNPQTGELKYGDCLVRKVRVLANPSHIQRILDAFESRGWPRSITDPLPDNPDQHRLHQALQSLNKGLERMRFHGQQGGRAIYWLAT